MLCGRFNDGSVVAAHSNSQKHGKGIGIKSHDVFIAYLCDSCHSMIDNGKNLSEEERIELWREAHDKSLLWLFTSGHISL